MKVKTSITLSEDIIQTIDRLVTDSSNRSQFIETALRTFLAQHQRDEQQQRDLKIINRRHAHLNKETMDTLVFQGEW